MSKKERSSKKSSNVRNSETEDGPGLLDQEGKGQAVLNTAGDTQDERGIIPPWIEDNPRQFRCSPNPHDANPLFRVMPAPSLGNT